jgi:hypothetical protein
MRKLLLLYFISVFCLQSYSQESSKQECNVSTLKSLNIYPVNSVLKLPPFIITDSTQIGTSILTYNIKGVDSSFTGAVIVYNNKNYPDQIMDQVIEDHFTLFRSDSDHDKYYDLLKDDRKVINGIKVGFVKERSKNIPKQFFLGRISFYRGKMQVDILLDEEVADNRIDKYSTLDCIFDNFQIK